FIDCDDLNLLQLILPIEAECDGGTRGNVVDAGLFANRTTCTQTVINLHFASTKPISVKVGENANQEQGGSGHPECFLARHTRLAPQERVGQLRRVLGVSFPKRKPRGGAVAPALTTTENGPPAAFMARL